MECEVLVSTMNCKNKDELVRSMNIKKCIIINQVTQKDSTMLNDINSTSRILSYQEKGLSKSRNKALANSDADICIVADDDLVYEDNYDTIIKNAYNRHPDADLIAFVVGNERRAKDKVIFKEKRLNRIQTLKLSSVHITFKKKSILDKKIKFDEDFGAGTNLFCGEENIFLYDCVRSGLKIYYVPKKIATLKINESSWFKGYDSQFFQTFGAVFYRMSRILSPFLIFQFVIRKRKKYIHNMTMLQAFKNMFVGVKMYKENHREGEAHD